MDYYKKYVKYKQKYLRLKMKLSKQMVDDSESNIIGGGNIFTKTGMDLPTSLPATSVEYTDTTMLSEFGDFLTGGGNDTKTPTGNPFIITNTSPLDILTPNNTAIMITELSPDGMVGGFGESPSENHIFDSVSE